MLRFWRLRKFIRDTTTPIPYDTARKWDTRLGRTYNILAFTSFVISIVAYVRWRKSTRDPGGLNETDAEFYTRTLNIDGARVLRFDITGRKLMDEYISPDEIREKYHLPPPQNPALRPSKPRAPKPATEDR